ncbi:hypothetical protein [Parabacteroides distasonis]|uniref:hypothetical protein n=1 Tax=Parabacteroides distasonis TaxID=823 RepID=UPI00321A1F25
MDYNRYSIDLIKDSFSQYVANGTKNDTALSNGITELSKAIDRAVIAGEDASALEMLKNDLQYITYQLCPL